MFNKFRRKGGQAANGPKGGPSGRPASGLAPSQAGWSRSVENLSDADRGSPTAEPVPVTHKFGGKTYHKSMFALPSDESSSESERAVKDRGKHKLRFSTFKPGILSRKKKTSAPPPPASGSESDSVPRKQKPAVRSQPVKKLATGTQNGLITQVDYNSDSRDPHDKEQQTQPTRQMNINVTKASDTVTSEDGLSRGEPDGKSKDGSTRSSPHSVHLAEGNQGNHSVMEKFKIHGPLSCSGHEVTALGASSDQKLKVNQPAVPVAPPRRKKGRRSGGPSVSQSESSGQGDPDLESLCSSITEPVSGNSGVSSPEPISDSVHNTSRTAIRSVYSNSLMSCPEPKTDAIRHTGRTDTELVSRNSSMSSPEHTFPNMDNSNKRFSPQVKSTGHRSFNYVRSPLSSPTGHTDTESIGGSSHASTQSIRSIPGLTRRQWHVSSPADLHIHYDEEDQQSLKAPTSPGGQDVYGWQSKNILTWSPQDVLAWCYSKGLVEVTDLVQELELTGKQLLHLTEDDLNEHGVDESVRERMMTEIDALQDMDSSTPWWNLKRASLRRKNLETSNQQLQQRLSSLEQQSLLEQQRISKSLAELREQQERTQRLLQQVADGGSGNLDKRQSMSVEDLLTDRRVKLHRRRSSAGSINLDRRTSISRKQVPVVRWNREDVLAWLTRAGLPQFVPAFTEKKVTGRDLANIDMELLDELGIVEMRDRDLLLSKLYELQNPGGSLKGSRSHSYEASSADASITTPKADIMEAVMEPGKDSPASDLRFNQAIGVKVLPTSSHSVSTPGALQGEPDANDSGTDESHSGSSMGGYGVPRKQLLPSGEKKIIQPSAEEDMLELLREIELLKETIKEKEEALEEIERENLELAQKSKKVEELQAKLDELQTAVQTGDIVKVQLVQLEQDFQEVTSEVQEREGSIANLRSLASNQIYSHQSELDQQLAEEEISLDALIHRRGEISTALERARSQHKQCVQSTERNSCPSQPEPSLYSALYTEPALSLRCHQLPLVDGQYGFMAGTDNQRHLVVRHTDSSCPLRKRDRLVEANGVRLLHGAMSDLNKVLAERPTSLELVVLRDPGEQQEGDMEGLKEDLAIATLEAETLQEEKQELEEEVARLRNVAEEGHEENVVLRAELENIKHRVSYTSVSVSKLSSGINGDSHSMRPFSKDSSPMERLDFLIHGNSGGRGGGAGAEGPRRTGVPAEVVS